MDLSHLKNYLERGLPIIPLQPRGKKPIIPWQVYQSRRATEDEIREWFSSGSPNLGIVTGPLSNLTVVDFDTPDAIELAQAKGFPPTPLVKTAKGFHAYCRFEQGHRNFQKRADLPGIDLRAEGGYVVAPPSIHESGVVYSWVDGRTLDDIEPPLLPDWILAKNPSEKQPLTELYTGSESGSRNNALTRLVGSWVNDGGSLEEITEQARVWNAGNTPPLPDSELKRTIQSIYDRHHKLGPKIDPTDPLATAKTLVSHRFTTDEMRTLVFWQGSFYQWDGASYFPVTKDDLRAVVYEFAENAATRNGEPFKPTRSRVTDIEDALKGAVNLSDRITPPCWLSDGDHPNGELITCTNGLLHLPTMALHPPTASFFCLNSLGFGYEADAPPPLAWLTFLSQLWPDDPEAVATLQEVFGYLLTSDTSQQKIFLFVGPTRSGKGTIGRILTRLLGLANVAGPTLASLSQPFGMAPLIGKLLAVISDARLSARVDQHAITERLLAISGEDALSIPRKHISDYTAKLAVRFLILTNELPRLSDSSGALSNRFVILTLRNSFLGKEDPALTNKLLQELPGILKWSIHGWQRLQERGYFIQPASSAEHAQDLADLSSPISAFVRDVCEVGSAAQIECNRLYAAWKGWCGEQGREHPGTLQTFGRDLRAFLPGLSVTQPREEGKRIRVYQGIGLRNAVARGPDYCTRGENITPIYRENCNASDRVPSSADRLELKI